MSLRIAIDSMALLVFNRRRRARETFGIARNVDLRAAGERASMKSIKSRYLPGQWWQILWQIIGFGRLPEQF